MSMTTARANKMVTCCRRAMSVCCWLRGRPLSDIMGKANDYKVLIEVETVKTKEISGGT
jgi:hypothetical protein